MIAPSNPAEREDDSILLIRGLLIGLAVAIPIWGVTLVALWRLL